MTHATRTRRGFLLAELMAVLAIGFLLLGILGKMVVDMIYLQRVAAQHADRMAVMDGLTRRIRGDTRAAVNYEWREHSLVLHTLDSSGLTNVTYSFEPGAVGCQVAGEPAIEWRSRRLGFSCRIESGPRGDVLLLTFSELPPPRATSLPDREYAVAFLLPPPADNTAAPDERSTP